MAAYLRCWALGLLIWGMTGFGLLITFYVGFIAGLWLIPAVIIIFALLAAWIWFNTGYTITGSKLETKSGLSGRIYI